MNTLILRTRFEQSTPSSSSSRSSYYSNTSAGSRLGLVRSTRPVFISSPTPKRQPARQRRAA